LTAPTHCFHSGGLIPAGTPIPAIIGSCTFGTIYKAPEVGLNALWGDVRKFHVAFDHPAPATPTMQPLAKANVRSQWIKEECEELVDARTLVDQADAYIDIIYFAVGGLVELGIKPQPLWDFVQGANMAKLGPDGKPIKDATGKTRKPEGWVGPEAKMIEEIRRQVDAATAAVAFPK
jgi:predicted HAD superfamily Cof-like phosphohydrolase